MDDLIVQGGIVAGQQQDIAIQQGRIRAVAPGLHTAAREQLAVTGKLAEFARVAGGRTHAASAAGRAEKGFYGG